MIPQLDATTHYQLSRWIETASRTELDQAIAAGRAWLKSFRPETEDDETLIPIVKERLAMLEEAFLEPEPSPGLATIVSDVMAYNRQLTGIQCEDCQDSKVCQHCGGDGHDPNGPPGATCPVCEGGGICPYCRR